MTERLTEAERLRLEELLAAAPQCRLAFVGVDAPIGPCLVQEWDGKHSWAVARLLMDSDLNDDCREVASRYGPALSELWNNAAQLLADSRELQEVKALLVEWSEAQAAVEKIYLNDDWSQNQHTRRCQQVETRLMLLADQLAARKNGEF